MFCWKDTVVATQQGCRVPGFQFHYGFWARQENDTPALNQRHTKLNFHERRPGFVPRLQGLQFVFSVLRFLRGAVPWHPKTSRNMGSPRHESLKQLLDSIVSTFKLLFQFLVFFPTSNIFWEEIHQQCEEGGLGRWTRPHLQLRGARAYKSRFWALRQVLHSDVNPFHLLMSKGLQDAKQCQTYRTSIFECSFAAIIRPCSPAPLA